MIVPRLEEARRELLDLSARNRLLNTPQSSSRSSRLDIVDELSSEVFRILVLEKKKMTFLPRPDESVDGESNALSNDQTWEYDEEDDTELAERHVGSEAANKIRHGAAAQ